MSQSAHRLARITCKGMHTLWRFAYAQFRRSRHFGTALLITAAVRCTAQPVLRAFPLPQHLVKVDRSITLQEFEAVRNAAAADPTLKKMLAELQGLSPEDSAKEVVEASQIDSFVVTPIDLGSAGRSFVVEFTVPDLCGGHANCPKALYFHGEHGLHPVLQFGGWGFGLMQFHGSIPDVG